MNIDVRKPTIKVVLKKNVARATLNGSAPVSQRWAKQSATVDLTPYLSEANPVRVTKSVREPAGAFSVALSNKIDAEVLDSLYAVIEPMDCIDIYMSGPGYSAGADGPPIMMRGFVSNVQLQEGMGSDGKPARHVIVSGQDYGKILQIMQIFMMPNAPEDTAAMITSFPFFAKFGDFSSVMEAGAFTQTLFDKVVNFYINTMRGVTDDGSAKAAADARNKQYQALIAQVNANNDQRGDLNTQASRALEHGDKTSATNYVAQSQAIGKQSEALLAQAKALKAQGLTYQQSSAVYNIDTDIQVSGAQVSPFGNIGKFNGGTIYTLIQSYGDIGPWNEFFIEDRPNGPCAVYRPNPFMDVVTHELYLAGAKMPTVTDIDRSAVVSMTSSRSDRNVANYYWVDSPRFNVNYDFTSKAMALETADTLATSPLYVKDYGNVNPTLYGSRKLEEVTEQAGIEEKNNGNGTRVGVERNASRAGALAWMNLRREQLYLQNKDNVIFETGSMRLKGNENVKAGTYIRLAHGNMRSYFYVVSVTHDLTPFGSYFTEVQFERGTGFVDRVQASAGNQSPYYSELVTKQ